MTDVKKPLENKAQEDQNLDEVSGGNLASGHGYCPYTENRTCPLNHGYDREYCEECGYKAW